MSNQVNGLYEFGPFRLDAHERRLWKEGESISIPPKAFDTLLFLIQHSGQLIEKQEMLKSLWPESFVEEGNLSLYISIIRKALGDKPTKAEYIETVPKRGYRFLADVRPLQQELVDADADLQAYATAPDEKTGDDRQPESVEGRDLVPDKKTAARGRGYLKALSVGTVVLFVGLAVGTTGLWMEAVPQISNLVSLGDPVAGQQFFVTIEGDNFDVNSVQVIVTGANGCLRINNCVVPNNVLQGVTSTRIEAIPLTLGVGEFQIFVRNGPGDDLSNGWPIKVNPSTPTPAIVVDGHPHEWAGLKPLLEDPVGDGPFNPYGQYFQGEDFVNISVSNDRENLYFLLEFAGDYMGGIGLFLDSDLNASTGCEGNEYIVFVSPTAPGANLALGDRRNCSYKDDFPGAIVSKAQGRFVEAVIKMDTLRIITPGMIGIRMSATAIAPGRGKADIVGPEATYLLR